MPGFTIIYVIYPIMLCNAPPPTKHLEKLHLPPRPPPAHIILFTAYCPPPCEADLEGNQIWGVQYEDGDRGDCDVHEILNITLEYVIPPPLQQKTITKIFSVACAMTYTINIYIYTEEWIHIYYTCMTPPPPHALPGA